MNIMRYDAFQPINEIRYEDAYGSNFVDFVERYKKKIRKGEIKADKYYVQFTNYRDNDIDKTMVDSPDHHDPVGVYAYPLAYVLKHPSDIWYGAGAKNLRVIKDISRSKLTLPYINSEFDMRNKLSWLGINTSLAIKPLMKRFSSHFDGTANKWAKLFFIIVQHDISKEGYPLRSGAEQSKILRKEFDAIEDTSKVIKKAIINDREPEQICFLKRSAFDIIEVVRLHNRKSDRINITYPEPQFRKLAAQIAQNINDKLVNEDDISSSSSIFWTVKGRRINIKYDTKSVARDGLKIGQKHHRHATTHDYRYVSVNVNSELGVVSNEYHESESFYDIARSVKKEFENLANTNQPDSAFEPENKTLYKAKLKAAEDSARDAYFAAEKKKKLAELNRNYTTISKWAEMCGIPYERYGDDETDLEAYEALERCLYSISMNTSGNLDSIIEQSLKYTRLRKKNLEPDKLAFIEKTVYLLKTIITKYPILLTPGDTRRRFLWNDIS